MVAYSFAPRFAPLVESGQKTQTIRGHRKRHARPEEPVQLYTGMRTKHCRKLIDPDPVCAVVCPVEIHIDGPAGDEVRLYEDGLAHVFNRGHGIDEFARADGFDDWPDMRAWWRDTHGSDVFDGVLIGWERAHV